VARVVPPEISRLLVRFARIEFGPGISSLTYASRLGQTRKVGGTAKIWCWVLKDVRAIQTMGHRL